MKITTLGYLIHDGSYLMLHRTKKAVDPNHNKWIGVGGHVENGETPDECFIREVSEETGLTLGSLRLRGIVTFISSEWEDELMFVYTSDDFSGTLIECNEGDLAFIPVDRILSLPLWEGDRIFLRELMEDAPFFTLKLKYQGDTLIESVLDRSPL
ncbi:MAG: 8-oxo-dGTP diphosphatase [Clostridia bacterium]|nr:8-oxo-dGTP diphosphatase [Clostridia bacterium]